MIDFLNFIQFILFLGLFACAFMLHRTLKVYDERMRILDQVDTEYKGLTIEQAKRLSAHNEFIFKFLDSVTFNDMMFEFYTPVESFFERYTGEPVMHLKKKKK